MCRMLVLIRLALVFPLSGNHMTRECGLLVLFMRNLFKESPVDVWLQGIRYMYLKRTRLLLFK